MTNHYALKFAREAYQEAVRSGTPEQRSAALDEYLRQHRRFIACLPRAASARRHAGAGPASSDPS